MVLGGNVHRKQSNTKKGTRQHNTSNADTQRVHTIVIQQHQAPPRRCRPRNQGVLESQHIEYLPWLK